MEALNIVEGHANLIRKKLGIADDEVELMAKLREGVCRNQCPAAPKGSTALNEEDRCTVCNCIMQAKWRATDAKCPHRAW